MLTIGERTTLRNRCALLNRQGLERFAEHCALGNWPDAAKYVRELIAEREIAERANAVPFEVSGSGYRSQEAKPGTRVAPAPYFTKERVRDIGLAVVSVGGIVSVLGLVVIPLVVAVASAIISAVASVGPYLAGGALFVLFLRESFFGQKKTGSFPAESPRPSSGTVYNVYIGEGQNVTVQSGQSGQK